MKTRSLLFIVFVFAFAAGKGQRNCPYMIDEKSILANKNLDSFIVALEEQSFLEYTDVKHIPRSIKKQLDCLTGDFSIASKDGAFDLGCIVTRLPRRQLLYLAINDEIFVMTYLKGGFSLTQHILFIKYKEDKIVDLWTNTGPETLNLKMKKQILEYMWHMRAVQGRLNSNIVAF